MRQAPSRCHINQILYTNTQKIPCEQACGCLLGGKHIRKISWFNKLSVGRNGSPAVISCLTGDFPVLLLIPIIISLRDPQASLSPRAWLSLAQQPGRRIEVGYISS